ncbi:MAG: MarR family transcriptional regulator [Thermoleophilia bacterium]
MQSSGSLVGLPPIFRSEGQARVLADLLLDDSAGWRSLTEVARRTGLASSSVMREVDRLEAAGIVQTERVGNVRRVRADRSSRFHPELRGLVLKALGPEPVLAAELAGVEGVQAAYLFGSWARLRRDPAASAAPPRDLDLLVIGNPDPAAVYAACARAEEALGLEIDPVIVSPEAWDGKGATASERGFLAAVRADDPIAILGGP